jgi:serine/threonine protein kinase
MIAGTGLIKLIDFGFAKILSPSTDYRTYTNCGTIGYTAPEILLGSQSGYSFEVDIWSFGILLCELFYQSLPFENRNNPNKIMEQTIKGEIKMPRDLDEPTKDLLLTFFQVDPNLRITIDQIKEKSFFKDVDWEAVKQGQFDELPPYTPNPQKYKYILYNSYPEVSNLDSSLPNTNIFNDTPQKSKILGDFTMQKINKEFHDF